MGDVWYALGYGGHGVALATYLGNEVAGRITGETDASPFEEATPPNEVVLPAPSVVSPCSRGLVRGARPAGKVNGSPPADSPHQPQYAEVSASLGQLIRFFLWLGVVAFGAGGAHRIDGARGGGAAAMGDRRALSRPHRGDQSPPGPNSTEMTMHVGYVQRGCGGLGGGRRVHCPAAPSLWPSAGLTSSIDLPACGRTRRHLPVVLAWSPRPGQAGAAGTRPSGDLGGGGDRPGRSTARYRRTRCARRWGVIGLAAFYRPTGSAALALPLWLQGGTADDPPTWAGSVCSSSGLAPPYSGAVTCWSATSNRSSWINWAGSNPTS